MITGMRFTSSCLGRPHRFLDSAYTLLVKILPKFDNLTGSLVSALTEWFIFRLGSYPHQVWELVADYDAGFCGVTEQTIADDKSGLFTIRYPRSSSLSKLCCLD